MGKENIDFEEVAQALYKSHCLQFGDFILKDDSHSPYYINIRNIRSFPQQKQVLVRAFAQLIDGLQFDLVADIPTAVTPVVSSLTDKIYKPQITPRIDAKSYGSGKLIDGVYLPGQTALVFDDVISSSKSKFEAIKILKNCSLEVNDVVVVVDRQQGGGEELLKYDYNLHSIFTIAELALICTKSKILEGSQLRSMIAFLEANSIPILN